jgi:tetratricopeptide (TPR) repeat protein
MPDLHLSDAPTSFTKTSAVALKPTPVPQASMRAPQPASGSTFRMDNRAGWVWQDMRRDDEDDQSRDVESPDSKQKYKDFCREFKQRAKDGFFAAERYAEASLQTAKEKIIWKILLELADLCKREGHLQKAKRYFDRSVSRQPSAHQAWLEYAKMAEECGNLRLCQLVLNVAMNHCADNDSLLLKAIKLEEKLSGIEGARRLLQRVAHLPQEKMWKVLLEGALIEARAGYNDDARRTFKVLSCGLRFNATVSPSLGSKIRPNLPRSGEVRRARR